ncbi:MAG: hypothetical protein IKQ93_05015 [Candidatus Methanomethylophilaceae archaeon]|nr:hypothetical protein [Candidatus Methanomethylophilaceae archaeon]
MKDDSISAGKGASPAIKIGYGRDDIKRLWEETRDGELPPEVKEYLASKDTKVRGSRTALERLEGKHVLTMITYIDSHSPLTKTDIYNDISRSTGVMRKIDELRDMGLIDIYTTGRTNLNVIVITEKGKQVAEIIRSMVDILSETD